MSSDMDRISGSRLTGSVASRASSRWRCGHSTDVRMAPTSASLASPLMKFISACLENNRLAPASGEILDSFGMIASIDQISRCWMMLPATAAIASSRSGMPTAPSTSRSSFALAVQREQHGSEQERDDQAHPRRHAELAEARQQHHHRADARKHQHEDGGERRQERDVDSHRASLSTLPGSRSLVRWI
jgi:hypothetical protein